MENKEIAMPPLPEEVVEQVETPEVNEVVEEQAPVVQEPVVDEVVEEQVKPEEESPHQINFKALRAEKDRIEREKNEAVRKLEEYERPKQQPVQEDDDDMVINDDDLFEGKHYKKIQRQLKKQQEIIDKYQSQVQLTTTEARLKSQFGDFDRVVSEENIKKLRDQEPEIAQTLASTTDMYSKAVSAYKMIKKLGIYVEDNYQADRDVVKQNSLKPKPLASVTPQQGDSPLTKANAFANGLTKELKEQLWKEVQESAKQY